MIDRRYIASAMEGSRLTLRKVTEIVESQGRDTETRKTRLLAAAPPALRELLVDTLTVHKLLRDGASDCSFLYDTVESASYPKNEAALTAALVELEQAWAGCITYRIVRREGNRVVFRLTGADPERDPA